MKTKTNLKPKARAGSMERTVRPHVTLHEDAMLCLSSEIMFCKIKVGRVQRDMMVALESIDALVTSLDDAHRRVNEHREACKRALRPNDRTDRRGTAALGNQKPL